MSSKTYALGLADLGVYLLKGGKAPYLSPFAKARLSYERPDSRKDDCLDLQVVTW